MTNIEDENGNDQPKPQSRDSLRADLAEASVLSICIWYPALLYEARSWQLNRSDFFDPELGHFWLGLNTLFDEGLGLEDDGFDWGVIVPEFRKRWGFMPTPATLQAISNGSRVRGYMDYYASKVKHSSILRRVVDKCGDATHELPASHVPGELWETINKEAQSIFAEVKYENSAFRDAMRSLMDTTKPRQNIGSGIEVFDRNRGGFSPGEMLVIGGGPGQGKSALALTLAVYAATSGVGVLYVSLEMTVEQIAIRAAASVSRLSMNQLRDGTMTDEQRMLATETTARLAMLPIRMIAPGKCSVAQITSEIIRAKNTLPNLGMVVVDYVGLLASDNDWKKRNEKIAEASRTLKKAAIESEVIMVVLAQINREGRAQNKPDLHHLAESASLEQDGDIVWLLKSNPDEKDKDDSGLTIIMAKHRSNATAEFALRFDKPRCRIYDPEADGLAEFND